MLTFAPLPSLRSLLTFFFSKAKTEAEICRYWHAPHEQARLFSQSSWSLAIIALLRSTLAGKNELVAWVPDFFCNASLYQLRETGARIIFYKVDEQLAPDYSSFKALQESSGPPHLLLVVHYFGKPAPIIQAREFCKSNGAWLIEDAAHVLMPVKGIGTEGDFVVYSPHKLLPVPDGAILVARTGGPSDFSQEAISSMMTMDAIKEPLRSLRNKLSEKAGGRSYTSPTKWLVKRLIQKTGIIKSLGTYPPFQESPDHETPLVRKIYASNMSMKLLSKLAPRLTSAAMERQHNQLIWDEWIGRQSIGDADLFPMERPHMRNWTVYQASYKCEGQKIETVYKRLLKNGIPVSTWPDIAPEVAANNEQHAIAWRMRHDRIYLAVHQGLPLHRKKIIRQLFPLEQTSSVGIDVHLNSVDKAEWNKYMLASGPSNLMQAWDYGDAKAAKNKWDVLRYVFQNTDGPFAILQVLRKKILGVVTVYRINRGPLFFKAVDKHQSAQVLDRIAALGNFFKLRLLVFAPDERLAGSALVGLYQRGFRRFVRPHWESAWVDLRMPLDMLRKKLDGKWRNMLNFSEKAGLVLESGPDEDLFEWMIGQYGEMLHERKFEGIPVDFIRELYLRGKPVGDILVFRALYNGKPVAGICIAIHGNAATYLLGVNDDEGRNLKANQFLLWNVMAYLKNNNKDWFDLGGIDRQGTPGIAQFKLGVQGNSYENTGEFVKW